MLAQCKPCKMGSSEQFNFRAVAISADRLGRRGYPGLSKYYECLGGGCSHSQLRPFNSFSFPFSVLALFSFFFVIFGFLREWLPSSGVVYALKSAISQFRNFSISPFLYFSISQFSISQFLNFFIHPSGFRNDKQEDFKRGLMTCG